MIVGGGFKSLMAFSCSSKTVAVSFVKSLYAYLYACNNLRATIFSGNLILESFITVCCPVTIFVKMRQQQQSEVWGSWGSVAEHSGLLGCGGVVRDVLKDHISFIFRVKQCKKNLICMTLKMKALQSFEMSGTTRPTIQHYVSKDLHVQQKKKFFNMHLKATYM
jgi:hypothetical protein